MVKYCYGLRQSFPGLKHLDLHLLWRVKLIMGQEVVVPAIQFVAVVIDVQKM